MNLSFVDQGVSNSPSWIRGGAAGAAGALILSKIYFEDKLYSSGASRHLPLGEELIDSTFFVELKLICIQTSCYKTITG